MQSSYSYEPTLVGTSSVMMVHLIMSKSNGRMSIVQAARNAYRKASTPEWRIQDFSSDSLVGKV